MDLFRSKKRSTDIAAIGDDPVSLLQKKHRGLSGSMDDLLGIATQECDTPDTASQSDNSSSSESENEGESNKVSKRQKIFAKKVIKWEKQKEKEQRKKVQKNLISMDDFLRKQSEFKMWLYEEKSRNAGDLSSPKMKAHFKLFVRQWNKRKLPQKYYRSSSLSESPTPLTPRKCNMFEDQQGIKPLLLDGEVDHEVKEAPKSPFFTFGKTPPKVFRSKKLQLFASTPDVALLSVAPLGSPLVGDVQNKENTQQYMIPKTSGKATRQGDQKSTVGATPYKVSVFPWAVANTDNGNQGNESLDVCSTATPPSKSCPGGGDDENWPPPPSEFELSGNTSCSGNNNLRNSSHGNSQRNRDSPHVPPPPPPRLESLSEKSDCDSKLSPFASNYASPYDKLPVEWSTGSGKPLSEYQEPVDTVFTLTGRTIPEDSKMVIKSLSCINDEPDLSLYAKSFSEKRFNKEELEQMYAKPFKRSKICEPTSDNRLSKKELEEMYSKPLKRAKKSEPVTEQDSSYQDKPECQSGLYAEIMDHLNKSMEARTKVTRKEPDYETIDECLAKMNEDNKDISNSETDRGDINTDIKENKNELPEFAKLSKNKKKRVLAASSDKIYETYLSMGKNANPFKKKEIERAVEKISFNKALKKKYNSQPDISFNDGMQIYDTIDAKPHFENIDSLSRPYTSSFKPVDTKYAVENNQSDCNGVMNPKLNFYHRAKSCEDGLKNIETPSTPTILATPSFDSLCPVTPLSYRSGSSQSLPAKSGSFDSLSSHSSYMSISTSSSLSFAPDEKSGSLQSLHSEKSLSPVPEEVDAEIQNETDRSSATLMTQTVDMMNKDLLAKGLVLNTPGKISAAKHGIDLSRYLLNPLKQGENIPKHGSSDHVTHNKDIGNCDNQMVAGTKSSSEPNIGSKFIEAQSRLVIKETLSGVKTKVDQSKSGNKRELDRRHTVQTVEEIRTSINNRASNIGQVPNIGIAAKTRKLEASNKVVKSKDHKDSSDFGDENLTDIASNCDVATKVVGEGDDQYLETDLDMVVVEKVGQRMQKSKSHSGFDSSTSTVVTEIW